MPSPSCHQQFTKRCPPPNVRTTVNYVMSSAYPDPATSQDCGNCLWFLGSCQGCQKSTAAGEYKPGANAWCDRAPKVRQSGAACAWEVLLQPAPHAPRERGTHRISVPRPPFEKSCPALMSHSAASRNKPDSLAAKCPHHRSASVARKDGQDTFSLGALIFFSLNQGRLTARPRSATNVVLWG